MAGNIVRDVIIRTHVEHAGETGSRATQRQAGGEATRPIGGVTGVIGESSATRRARLHGRAEDALLRKAHKESIANIKAEVQQRIQQRRLAEKHHKATMRMLEERFNRERLGHRALARSLNETLAQAQARFSQQASSLQAQRGNMNRMMGVDARGNLARRQDFLRNRSGILGQGVGGGGGFESRSNYFSTGNASLDRLNQLGFQGFITTMTARLIFQLIKGSIEGLAGLSGEGEGVVAQMTRFTRGDARSRRDTIFQWAQDTGGGILRGVGAGDFAQEAGYGRRSSKLVQRGQELSGEIGQLLQMTMTKQMRKEDELIQRKRENLRQEREVLNQRLGLARAETQSAKNRLQGSVQQFGLMGKEGQERVREVFKKFNAGAMPEDFSREQREMIAGGGPLFEQMREFFSRVSAARGGFNEIAMGRRPGARFIRDVVDKRRDEFGLQKQVREINADPAFDIKLNIEKLEIRAKEVADQIAKGMEPHVDKLLDQVFAEYFDFMKTLLEEKAREERLGGGAASRPMQLINMMMKPGGMF